MKDTNLQIEDFKNSLIDIINAAELPPAVIYYVLTSIYQETEYTYKNYLQALRRKESELPPAQDIETLDETV